MKFTLTLAIAIAAILTISIWENSKNPSMFSLLPLKTQTADQLSHPNASILWNEINRWETQNGYAPFLEEKELCTLADEQISNLKEDWSSIDLQKINKMGKYARVGANAIKDIFSETDILSKWLSSPDTKKNFEDYFTYSCVRCNETICVQILANSFSKTQTSSPNSSSSTTIDPIIKCTIGQSCAPMQIKKSECLTYSVCCLVGGNTHVPVKSLDECIRAQNAYSQGNGGSQSNTTTNTDQTTTNTANILINCSYSDGKFQYDFGQLTYNACKVKTDEYWNSERQKISESSQANYPTSIPTTSTAKSQAEIDNCKSAVKSKYTDLITGCYIKYQGSASDSCARAYQDQSGAEMSQCY